MNKKIKVFSLPWHVAHQHELLKLPFDWYYLIQHTRKWGEQYRPTPQNVKWVTHYEPGYYDLAILHTDQQCLLPDLGKSILFREVREQIKDIPVIVINHGTPVYPEIFNQKAEEEGYIPTEKNGQKWARNKMKELLNGVSEMVVNSHQARDMWGWGQAIIHGLDADEWWNLRKEPRAISVIAPAGIGQKYYGRRLLQETRNVLQEKYGIFLIWVGEGGGESFAPSWERYKDFLGKTMVYFNPTFGSPMPRSRTEAMLSGCCIVTTRHHDADKFIEHGKNGFLVKDNPEDAASMIAYLINNYPKAVEAGEEGRKTAMNIFSGERFRNDWINLVERVLGKKII